MGQKSWFCSRVKGRLERQRKANQQGHPREKGVKGWEVGYRAREIFEDHGEGR